MTTAQANKRIEGDLKAVERDTTELMPATAGQGGEIGAQVRSRLVAAVDAADAACRRLEDTTVSALSATDRCIRAHPYETIGVFFGLGLLIGVLVSRR
jgi:ElaB/YqjD/DUF883 family membrane-anchored ribosome-binding protein